MTADDGRRIVLWEPVARIALRLILLMPIYLVVMWLVSMLAEGLFGEGGGLWLVGFGLALLTTRRRALVFEEEGLRAGVSVGLFAPGRLDPRGLGAPLPLRQMIAWRIVGQARRHLTLIMLDRRQIEYDFAAPAEDVAMLESRLAHLEIDRIA